VEILACLDVVCSAVDWQDQVGGVLSTAEALAF